MAKSKTLLDAVINAMELIDAGCTPEYAFAEANEINERHNRDLEQELAAQYIEDGMSEQEAVRHAKKIVRMGQNRMMS